MILYLRTELAKRPSGFNKDVHVHSVAVRVPVRGAWNSFFYFFVKGENR